MTPNGDEYSFPEFGYPSLRDGPVKTCYHWLLGKSMDDGAEGFWRIHNKLYDFTDFIQRHPGGDEWISYTKGTDITEAFESHHISTLPEWMLQEFYIRDAVTKRNSPFTFEKGGFYDTLKKRVREDLKRIPKDANWVSKRYIEGLISSVFILCILACRVEWFWGKAFFVVLGAIALTCTASCAHNFIHQKDNWRMYLYHFALISSREIRIFHVLSHHLYPNTLMDLEISVYEPFIQWMPRKNKSFVRKYGPIFWSPFIFMFLIDMAFFGRLIGSFVYKRTDLYKIQDLLPILLLTSMYYFGNCTFGATLLIWVVVLHLCSLFYVANGLNAAHHHPDLFHDGDAPPENRDWGLFQIHTVMDRSDINGSLYKVLISYGNHCLHHLFPTLDHAHLPYIEESFVKTCKEFNAKLKMSKHIDMFIASYKQMARTECIKKIN